MASDLLFEIFHEIYCANGIRRNEKYILSINERIEYYIYTIGNCSIKALLLFSKRHNPGFFFRI